MSFQRNIIAGAVFVSATTWSVLSHAQVQIGKREDVLSHFGCGPTKCDLVCRLAGQEVNLKYDVVYVYQFKEHPRRLWMSVDGRRYFLGDDDSCRFGNPPTSPIDAPTPPGTRIDVPRSNAPQIGPITR